MAQLLRRKKSFREPVPAAKPEPGSPEAAMPGPSHKPPEFGTIRGEVKYPWGTVARASIKAQGITVAQEAAAAQATVEVMDRDVITDSAGKYEIPTVEAGSYTVTVEPPFPGYGGAPEKVVVTAGQISYVDFYLDYLKTLVHGYVYDKDGKSIAGASVSEVLCGKGMKSTLTDGTGYFKFDDATPGNLFIRVNAPGYMGETRDFAAKMGERTKLEFHLTKGGCKIHGAIFDQKGDPLSGEIILSSESGVILHKTPSNAETGYYEFSVVPGTYNVLAVVWGYLSQGWKGPVSADTKVDIKLGPIPEQKEDYTLGA